MVKLQSGICSLEYATAGLNMTNISVARRGKRCVNLKPEPYLPCSVRQHSSNCCERALHHALPALAEASVQQNPKNRNISS